MFILEKESTLADMKDQACLAGIEKPMKELSFLLMGPTLTLMKSLMQTTTAVYCLGKSSVLLPLESCKVVFSCLLFLTGE